MNDTNKMVELDGADVFADWNNMMGSDPTPKANDGDFSLDNLMTDGGDDHWLQIFRETNLCDMDLVALTAMPAYVHEFKTEQAQMRAQAHIFLLNLANTHMNDLRVAGLSDDQINALTAGTLPINWTIHLKYPVAYGGTITPDNLVLMPQHPFHEDLHHFINRQIVSDAGIITPTTLYVPVPKSAVYVPFASNEMATQVIHFKMTGGDK